MAIAPDPNPEQLKGVLAQLEKIVGAGPRDSRADDQRDEGANNRDRASVGRDLSDAVANPGIKPSRPSGWPFAAIDGSAHTSSHIGRVRGSWGVSLDMMLPEGRSANYPPKPLGTRSTTSRCTTLPRLGTTRGTARPGPVHTNP